MEYTAAAQPPHQLLVEHREKVPPEAYNIYSSAHLLHDFHHCGPVCGAAENDKNMLICSQQTSIIIIGTSTLEILVARVYLVWKTI